MLASIIIPTCNRLHDLRQCLERVVKQLPNNSSVEVIVTDDGLTNASRQMIKEQFSLVKWIKGPQRGPAANRNHGASKALGHWFVFLDDDCRPNEGYLNAYIRFFGDEEVNALTTIALGPTFRIGVPPSLLWEAPHNPEGKVLISCNFAIHRDCFLRVGRFDERYPVAAFEDTEFEFRCRCSDCNIAVIMDASVLHPLRKKPSANRLAARWEGQSIYAFDQGASKLRVLWGLWWHATRVIQSRFRDQPINVENVVAAGLFLMEWLWVIRLIPGWVTKWGSRPRSEFWVHNVKQDGPVANFGF